MGMSRILHIIHHRQEGCHIHPGSLTGLTYRLVTKTQRNAKATQHLQHTVIIADHIAHGVQLVIFLCHCIFVFLLQRYNKVHNLPLFY